MRALVVVMVMVSISACALTKATKTEEGRKLILDSPEIRQIIEERDLDSKVAKWCDVDPLIRFAVRFELMDQGITLPVLSDASICGVEE